eukprot:jgi/Bigna1/128589/aug1.7_g3297
MSQISDKRPKESASSRKGEIRFRYAEVQENDRKRIRAFPKKLELPIFSAKNDEEAKEICKRRLAQAEDDVGAIEELFRLFDNDQDGFIDAEDLASSFRDLREEMTVKELQYILHNVHSDSDGKVDIVGFVMLMNDVGINIFR